MDRFRVGLLIAAIVLAGALLIHAVQGSPSATSGGGTATSAQLLPTDERTAAPDFSGINSWINSPPLSLTQLRGKVVLVDFWTYSCINCIRTIPHLQQLDATYRSRGLVIVGVHSPEFDFEKVRANVERAVRNDGVTWPVALDSEMSTWNVYQNQFWPAEYLLDQQGRFAYAALGEGHDAATNSAVASLLSAPLPSGPSATPPDSGQQTPELYAGSRRGSLADGERYGNPDWSYADPGIPHDSDAIQLTGDWHDAGEYVEARGDAVVRLRFQAQQLYIVASTASGSPSQVVVMLDGNSVPAGQRGVDLGAGAAVAVGEARLYRVLTAQDPGHHLVELRVPRGFRLYTFTFG